MRAAGRWVGPALTAAALACVHPSATPVEMCSPPAKRPARPEAECFHAAESRRYVGQLGSLIGETLSGWRSHPGAAELSVTFADDATVASVCTDSVDGPKIATRIADAAERVRSLPAGPACFASRRLDFAWKSGEVTAEHVRQATHECQRRVERHRRLNLFCLQTSGCSAEDLRERREQRQRELRACVLEKVPLELELAGSHERVFFLPIGDPDPDPDPELAARALDLCNALGDREVLVACMRMHGWQPRE